MLGCLFINDLSNFVSCETAYMVKTDCCFISDMTIKTVLQTAPVALLMMAQVFETLF
jgi:hypothetical protein